MRSQFRSSRVPLGSLAAIARLDLQSTLYTLEQKVLQCINCWKRNPVLMTSVITLVGTDRKAHFLFKNVQEQEDLQPATRANKPHV
eukprot:2528613-Amphidinium_carterae.1